MSEESATILQMILVLIGGAVLLAGRLAPAITALCTTAVQGATVLWAGVTQLARGLHYVALHAAYAYANWRGITGIADTEASEPDDTDEAIPAREALIRRCLSVTPPLSKNQIAQIVGGNRNATLALIAELEAEVAPPAPPLIVKDARGTRIVER